MKHIQLFSLLALFAFNASAQNVGIGTPTPLAPLHVSGITAEKLRLENTTGLNTNITSDLFFKTGTYFTGGIKTIGTGTNYARLGLFTYAVTDKTGMVERLSILDGGNVGIGTLTPTAKLEVNGTMKLTDGTQGDKKVLTSDAAGNATWQNQAYGNTERFQFRLYRFGTFGETLTTLYNFGTVVPSVTSNDTLFLQINTAGLYHIDLNFYAKIVSPSSYKYINCHIRKNTENLSSGFVPIFFESTSLQYPTSYDKSFDVYCGALDILKFIGGTYYGFTASDASYLTVTGSLITE